MNITEVLTLLNNSDYVHLEYDCKDYAWYNISKMKV